MTQPYYDCHLHSWVSMDSAMHTEYVCEKAITQGLTGICFTEHQDFYSGHPLAKNGHVEIDIDFYDKQIAAARERFGQQLQIYQGVELGLQINNQEENERFIQSHAFDFVLGSVHTIAGKEISSGEFYTGKDKKTAYTEYFQSVYQVVCRQSCFHCLGHLDLVRRRGNFADNCIDYAVYGEIIDEILRTLIAKGKGIEVNTAGIRYGVGSVHPDMPILKRYRELGGEIVTCGSDGHRLENVGQDISVGYALLKAYGFRFVSLFVGGKEQKIPLV